MKRILLALAVLSASTLAQNAQQPTPPPYCKPCLFYGGDFDPSGPNPNILSNSFTARSRSAVYVPFYVPTGQTWTIGGVFSNNMSNISVLDPPELGWTISSGISAGNPGTVIASGTSPATLTPTGRTWQIYTEYTALARFAAGKAVTLTAGVYWMTAVPVCTGSECGSFGGFWLSDVEDVPAPNHKGTQPKDDSLFLWNGGGYFFAPTGGSTGVCQGNGCDKFSVGLLGYAAPSN